jgi:N6-L-threonylcarbamoyladenine synthase
MSNFLGIDTSNYSTSVALFSRDGDLRNEVKLLPVAPGEKGLRQSDAVFHHVKAFPQVYAALGEFSTPVAIGVSTRPRSVEGSYMPCFLSGESFARVLGEAFNVSVFEFSHQQGHVAAALLSVNREDLIKGQFYAFHLSGGTMELLYVDTLNSITPVCVTNDVTAGQLIDRIGVALGYGFPAGKMMSELAESGKSPVKYKIKVADGKINLSGVENKALELMNKGESKENVAAFVLRTVSLAVRAMIEYGFSVKGESLPVVMVGGVSSSSVLRRQLSDLDNILFAAPELSRDNAMGIAYLASLKYGDKL